MKIAAALIAAGAALLLGGQSWDWSDDTEWPDLEESKAVCRALRHREPPAADRPTAAEARALRGCDSEALYYGIGTPPDPVRARQCAFLEMVSGEEPVFGGRTMLMTAYANGVGVVRNLDNAIHLACGIQGAPAEVDGRVRHLVELRDSGWTGNDFDLCDDVTSGLMMGHCSAHAAAIAGARRTTVLARLTAGWSEADRRAFAPLRQAFDAYVEAHGRGEVDLSGSARGAMVTGAEEALRDEFVRMIDQLEGGAAPSATRAQLEAADGELNRVYREVMRREFSAECVSCVTREGIRDAQRAWLRYRDAFLDFAAARYPQGSRDSLAAWLTRQRTELLSNGDY